MPELGYVEEEMSDPVYSKEELEEILKPIRECDEKHDLGKKCSFDPVSNHMLRAIEETLKKAGKK